MEGDVVNNEEEGVDVVQEDVVAKGSYNGILVGEEVVVMMNCVASYVPVC